jgi:hypothetical protein
VLADEASGAVAIANSAQIADAAAFVLTIDPPPASLNGASLGGNRYASLTTPLNDCEQSSGDHERRDEAGARPRA